MAVFEVRNRQGMVVSRPGNLASARIIARHHHATTDDHFDVYEIREVWSTETVPEAMARRFEIVPNISPEAQQAATDIASRYRDPSDTLAYGAAVHKLRQWGFNDRQADDILHPTGARQPNGCRYPRDL